MLANTWRWLVIKIYHVNIFWSKLVHMYMGD